MEAQRAHAHNEQQVVADAQRAGRGNGAGRRRNEYVRDIQPGAKAPLSWPRWTCIVRFTSALADGVEDNETAESQNTGMETTQPMSSNSQLRLFFPHQHG